MDNIRIHNGIVEIVLSGKVYADKAIDLRERLFPYLGAGYNRFWFDMTAMDYIDSSGIGFLLAIHKRADKLGGEVVITGLQGDMYKLFELTQLTHLFKLT
ncbi:STAS domain-containing protein [Cohnella sp. WQ 127256]|uniref:STAS domain-containing protein n=1 Tax=Cohnella sp. WQ 127256 TaxID=2938790 RepID=UPI00211765EF|nr:STAS domain-containing protein [Cohnella sp. WQ 127256]